MLVIKGIVSMSDLKVNTAINLQLCFEDLPLTLFYVLMYTFKSKMDMKNIIILGVHSFLAQLCTKEHFCRDFMYMVYHHYSYCSSVDLNIILALLNQKH